MTRRSQQTLACPNQEPASDHLKEAALQVIKGGHHATASQYQLADECNSLASLKFKPVQRKDAYNNPLALELTAQQLLLNAIAFHEKAIKHHRHACQLYDRGDLRQANTHVSIACKNARSALTSGDFIVSEDAQMAPLQPQRSSA